MTNIKWFAAGACCAGLIAGLGVRATLAKPGDDDKAVKFAGTEGPKKRAAETAGKGESNEQLDQPPLINDSLPLANDADRAKSIKIQQQLTVDLLAMANIFKQAHWNLSGPIYFSLHEFYDAKFHFYQAQADIFAERLLHLGSSVDGRYSTITRTTLIPDMVGGYETDAESLRLLIDRLTILQKETYAGLKATEDTDAPSSNKMQDLAYLIDKDLWQMRIHLQHPGGTGDSLPYSDKQGKAGKK